MTAPTAARPTAATLRRVAQRAEHLAADIRALAQLLAEDPDLHADTDLLDVAETVHEAAQGVLAAADALPRRRPRPRTLLGEIKARQEEAADPAATPQTAGPAASTARPAPDVATQSVPYPGPSAGPLTDTARGSGAVAAGPAPIAEAHPAPAAEVAALAEAVGFPLTPWQRQIVETAFTVPGRLSAAASAPRSLEPRPFTAPPVCPPPVLRSRGRAALARLHALAGAAALEIRFASGRLLAAVCRRFPQLPVCAGLEWR